MTIYFFKRVMVGAFFVAFSMVAQAHAWEYDSGWLNLSGSSSTSRCVYSHHMPWVRACSVVEGPQGHPNAQWFVSDIKLPHYTFSKGNCQVQTRSAYSGTKQMNEDFRLTVNGRTVVVRDQGNSGESDEVHTVTIPGQFTFYNDWNRLYFAGDSARGWSGSVWFGDYHIQSWGGDVLEAPGIRAVRVQCDDASPKPVCGNGTKEAGEQCDDGNSNNTDQCSNSCTINTAQCGNGIVESWGGEQCDDGNSNDHDACNNSCHTNSLVGKSCPYTAGTGERVITFSKRLTSGGMLTGAWYESVAASIPLGSYEVRLASYDGYPGRERTRAQTREQYKLEIKRGNQTIATSGVSQDLEDYKREVRWSGTVNTALSVNAAADRVVAVHINGTDTSDGPDSLEPVCALLSPTVATCGNGIKEAGEQCDDGNQDNTDACTNICENARCGDGYTQSGEQCDDGNTRNGDGCSALCTVETKAGSCGAAIQVASCSNPTKSLCAIGAPSAPSYNAATRKWEWSCGTKKCSTKKRCGYTEVTP